MNYRSTTITGLNIANNDYYFLRWVITDAAGTGSRDEFGLDDIQLVANPSNFSFNLSGNVQSAVIGQNTSVAFNSNTTLASSGTLTLNATGAAASVLPNVVFTNNGTVTTNSRPFTVRSNSTGDGIITGTTDISGITVERYITRRSVRKNLFLASPVTAQISDAWQQQIHITGNGSGGTICPTLTPHSNGFDATLNNNASMFTFNPTAAQGSRWTSIANTNATNLIPGTGYRVIVRGDRTTQGCLLLDGSVQIQDSVTLRATGTLAQGNVAVTLQEGFNLIGNPYQAPINFTTVASDNSSTIDNSYWTYNPANTAGIYSVYNAGTLTNKPGGYTNDNIIAIGQAFFVRKPTAGSVTVADFFRSGQRSTTAQTGLFRTQNWLGMARVALRANDDTHLDETVVRFSNETGVSNTAAGSYDAVNLSEGSVGISSIKSGTRYSIQTRTAIVTADTVSLHIVSTNNGSYKLHFGELQIGSNNALLIDKFLNQQQAISEGDSYSFTTTNDPASKGNRFDVVFRSSATLPVNFSSIAAQRTDDATAQVQWIVPSDVAVNQYTIERSYDGKRFEAIGSVAGKQQQQPATYQFTDTKATPSMLYYRVKAIAADGAFRYSAVAKLYGKASHVAVQVYPNPVTDVVNVVLPSVTKATSYRIVDATGKVVATQQVQALPGSTLTINAVTLAKGAYYLTIVLANGDTAATHFVK
ncbi:MAG: T9SS type A sorting domain-containing protein [Chitinophagaceae bacterium]